MASDPARPETGADLGLGGLWADAPVLSVYSTRDAVRDGLLIDARAHPELGELTREHLGRLPVYLSRNLYERIERAATNPRSASDWKGIFHDILTLSGFRRRPARYRSFEVRIVGAGRPGRYRIWLRVQEDGLFLMLPGDD